MYDSINTFITKINRIKTGLLSSPKVLTFLPYFSSTCAKYENDFETEQLIELLDKLISEFNNRFSDFKFYSIFNLFRNPFSIDVSIIPSNYHQEVYGIQFDPELKALFGSKSIIEFYKVLPETYGNIKSNAIEIISMFGSTYSCEQFFSKLKLRKNRHSTNITDNNLKHCLKLASLIHLEPDIDFIISSKQIQPSH